MSARAAVFILALLLVSCAPNPVDLADAQAINAKAVQDSADRAQARAQQAEQFELQQAERQRISDQAVASAAVTWRFATLAASIALMSLGICLAIGLIGGSLAFVRAANMRASTVYIDERTGQYPLIHYEGRGFVTLTDPNTGATMLLNTRSAADRQMITGSMAVRLSGIVSHNARLHKSDPTGVALVGTNPVLIEAAPTSTQEASDYDD